MQYFERFDDQLESDEEQSFIKLDKSKSKHQSFLRIPGDFGSATDLVNSHVNTL